MATIEEIQHLRLPDDAYEFVYVAAGGKSTKFEELILRLDGDVLIRVEELNPKGYAFYKPVNLVDLTTILHLCGKQNVMRSPNDKVVLRFLDFSTISKDRLEHILEIVRLAAIGRMVESSPEEDWDAMVNCGTRHVNQPES